jgi:hypothetical protein
MAVHTKREPRPSPSQAGMHCPHASSGYACRLLLADVIGAGGLDLFDSEAFAGKHPPAELKQYVPAP